ncbi:hypothetical protein CCC_03057 [Paramagnetospirillum magnetotacticum MS-1]|uniref:DUF1178 family protein n=1 Tax=Paramagnetospirillum magnetotacticum MS-1 TaxID=272627 RepID=A0A0C2YYV3_PARME|nr:DUF1178 family protein [Paramagnetospirillum magnetotacticum]KIM00269.1 hypothetical protein CCC_03057 [Paramagnetospirillum magnetotacticum MS-1]
MILFELRCSGEHHFEAWFKDGATYDRQAAAGEISCPQCGDTHIQKALMAPRLAKARGSVLDAQAAAGELRKMLVDLKHKVQASCDYVGERFPDEARKIHYGDAEARPIYGEATPADAAELEEEGVAVARIPWVAEGN